MVAKEKKATHIQRGDPDNSEKEILAPIVLPA